MRLQALNPVLNIVSIGVLSMVKSGSSYLSQSEFPLTFGLGKHDRAERVVIDWPSGRTEDYKDLAARESYRLTEGKGITPLQR